MILYQFAISNHIPCMLRDINSIRRINAARIVEEIFGGDLKKAADRLDTQPSFVGRITREEAAGKRGIGDKLARKLEKIAKKPANWLDQDHERMSPELEALTERYRKSTPDVQALIRLALDDPNMPLPKEIRPSLRTMLEGVRMAIAAQLQDP